MMLHFKAADVPRDAARDGNLMTKISSIKFIIVLGRSDEEINS